MQSYNSPFEQQQSQMLSLSNDNMEKEELKKHTKKDGTSSSSSSSSWKRKSGSFEEERRDKLPKKRKSSTSNSSSSSPHVKRAKTSSSPLSLSSSFFSGQQQQPFSLSSRLFELDQETLKEEVKTNITHWQHAIISSVNEFDETIKRTLKAHYPADKKALLDHVLANFLLCNPEQSHTILSPLIEKLMLKQMVYHKKHAPFYAFLNLFTNAFQQVSSMDDPRMQILMVLTEENMKQDTFPLSSWIADCLDGNDSLRDQYFQHLVQSGWIKQILSIFKEDVNKKTSTLTAAMVPAILNDEHATSDLSVFSEMLKHYFLQQPPAQTQKLLHQLLSGESIQRTIHSLFQLLHKELPMNQFQWFSIHFLNPLLQGVAENLPAAETLLRNVSKKINNVVCYHNIGALYLFFQQSYLSTARYAKIKNTRDYCSTQVRP
jgi:hypothetical protein